MHWRRGARGVLAAAGLAAGLAVGGARAAGAAVRQLTLPATDMVYNRSDGRLYVSLDSPASPAPGVAGNSVAALDPVTGRLGPSVAVGGPPGILALSDDGRFLYVALSNGGMVRRLALPSLTPDLSFSVGQGPNGPDGAVALAVMPGHPETVAIARAQLYGQFDGIAIYDNGVPRPAQLPGSPDEWPVTLQFSESPARLYAYSGGNFTLGFSRLAVDAAGVHLIDPRPEFWDPLLYGTGFRYDAGLAYFSSGRVIDPETAALAGTYAGSPFLNALDTLVAPDAALGRVYFLTGADGPRVLQAFDRQRFLPVGTETVIGVEGRLTGRLLRWGAEGSEPGGGLAFRSERDQIFILQTPLVPAAPLVLTFTPAVLDSGAPSVVTGRIDLRGAAPPGGLAIPLTSDAPALAAVPPQVLVPEGATTAQFPVQTRPVTAATTVTISGAYQGEQWTGTLSLLPQPHLALTLAADRVVGGASTEGILQIAPPAPEAGVTIRLLSDSPAVRLPVAVTIVAGGTSVRFPIATRPVAAEIAVHLSATDGAASDSATLTLLPRDIRVAGLALAPSPATSGRPVTGTVTLDRPAPEGGVAVSFTSSRPHLAPVPPAVRVAAGSTTAAFSFTPARVRVPVQATLTAALGSSSTAVPLTVVPAGALTARSR